MTTRNVNMMAALMTQAATPQQQLLPLCRALRLARLETGVGPAEIARRMGEKLSRVSRYYNDREPDHAMVVRLERAYRLPSGWLWTHAGYLEPAMSFDDMLAVDPNVSEDGKLMLRRLYSQLATTYRERHGALLTTEATPAAHSSRRATS